MSIFPDVVINVKDRSKFMSAVVDIDKIFVVIGEFEYGEDNFVFLDNKDDFEKYFGSFEKCKSKTNYYLISNLLNYVPVYVANVLPVGAKYKAVKVGSTFSEILLDNKEYNFNVRDAMEKENNKTFKYTFNKDYLLNSVKFYYTYNNENKVCYYDGSNFVGDNVDSVDIDGNEVVINFVEENDNNNVEISFVEKVSFIIVSKVKGKFSDGLSISIEKDNSNEYRFTLKVYYKSNLVEVFNLSKKVDDVDGFGNNLYLSQVNDRSDYINVIDNINYLGVYEGNYVFTEYGNYSVSVSDYIRVINKLENIDNWDVFVGGGLVEVLNKAEYTSVVNTVSGICSKKYGFAFFDTYGDEVEDIEMFLAGIGNNMRISFYAPSGVVNYNGVNIRGSASCEAAIYYAMNCASGNVYVPPVGVGNKVRYVRINKYYNEEERKRLSDKYVNVVKYFKSYGNIIYDNVTYQGFDSETSFINCVLCLNDMIKTFKNLLPVINFNLINEYLFYRLNSLINDVMRQLVEKDGGIEDNYIIKFNSLTDAKERKVVDVNVVFTFQGFVKRVNLTLTYTTQSVIASLR